MSAIDWAVIAAGLAGIGFVNCYFFAANRGLVHSTAAAAASSGRQEVTITVRGGYSPSTVRTVAGQPVRLIFNRQESSSCSEEVVFPAFGVRRFLARNERTVVEITPPSPGTYEFTCGMGMLHGRVVAE